MEREYLSLHEVEIREVRAKAIDEFEKQINRLCFGFKASQGNLVRVDVVQNALKQIAEQLKEGGK